MTAAVVVLAALGLALTVLTGWLARRHVLAVESNAANSTNVARQLAALEDDRDAAIVQWRQAAADLGAEKAAHRRTAAGLAAAREVLRDQAAAKLAGASDADLARITDELLKDRAAVLSARADSAARSGDGPPAPADVPGPGAATEPGPSPSWAD